ncbi:MAG: RraA family protein [Clostridiales bacterium]|jgi:regulator of RNase E activity RraA|nr:RraA family protein [Clostridiales bacterium]
MKFGAYEDIVQITKAWTGERLPDGRPKVSDDILRRLRNITLEEAWAPLWTKGYRYQFEGEFRTTHKDAVLVGRAVTGVMVPWRPDLDSILIEYGTKEEGRKGTMNQWVIDQLIEDDVVVIDLFDKIFQGTFVGGNLSTAIHARTKRGGAVIWGGVRDLEQIVKIPDNHQTYYRGVDPTGIGDVTLVGLNSPCRIGKAICLPGDVVFGTISGVLFIPPHLAETCAIGAEKAHIRDIFAFDRLAQKVYTTAQVDTNWTVAMVEDFIAWCGTDPRAEGYKHLNWDDELAQAREFEKAGPQPAQIRI